MSTLNERAGKALGDRWREGMRVDEPDSITTVVHAGPGRLVVQHLWPGDPELLLPPSVLTWSDGASGLGWYDASDGDFRVLVPDMSDPATRGAFLAVVREAWGDPGAHTRRTLERDRWALVLDYPPGGPGVYFGATEAEALVAALESAPR
jgi:hypothetical protein